MSEKAATRYGLSPVNSRLLAILLAIVIALVTLIVLAAIAMAVLMTFSLGSTSHQSLYKLAASSPAVRHDALALHSNVRVTLPNQPVIAARDLVHSVSGIQLPCYPNDVKQWYTFSRGCPVTPLFRRYLLAHMRDIDPICQCQNYAIHNAFHLLYQRAGLAAVSATLTFTYNKVYIVFVEINRGNGWMVVANYVTRS